MRWCSYAAAIMLTGITHLTLFDFCQEQASFLALRQLELLQFSLKNADLQEQG